MSSSEDDISSEVHTFSVCELEEGLRVASFTFSVPLQLDLHTSPSSQEPEYDSDGDLVVVRQGGVHEETLYIQHDLSTPLEGVGRQVWRGSLLLADYLLHHHTWVKGWRVMELGSGTGLASIVAALCGASVTATDIGEECILERIHSNINRNTSILERSQAKANISVRPLDLKKAKYRDLNDTFDVILAGDVIYDDDLTDALVDFLEGALVVNQALEVLVSLEKRFVFTVQELDTVAPAYDHFVQKLTEVESRLGLTIQLIATADVAQYFCYDRGTGMVLLKITKK